MVKFARYEPGRTELQALHDSAVRLIDETEPQPRRAGNRRRCDRRAGMTFAHPYLLLLLLLLPVLAWLKGRSGRQPAFLYSSVQLVKGIIGITRSRAGRHPVETALAGAGVVHRRAGPTAVCPQRDAVKASGVDIVVALDMSGSMDAEDDGFVLNGQQATRFRASPRTC